MQREQTANLLASIQLVRSTNTAAGQEDRLKVPFVVVSLLVASFCIHMYLHHTSNSLVCVCTHQPQQHYMPVGRNMLAAPLVSMTGSRDTFLAASMQQMRHVLNK